MQQQYKAGGERTVEVGGLRFVVMHRAIGEDGGATIEVFGDVDGKAIQVLRFDCFRKGPHYHYDPTGKNRQEKLDPAREDPLDWSFRQIRSNIPTMLRTAGFDALARQVDAGALGRDWTKVKDAVLASAPKA